MSPETPLTEVALMLPTMAARLLVDQPSFTQNMACTIMRDHVVFWERHGVVLDPVTFEVVAASIVVQAIATARYIAKLKGEQDGST